MEMRGNDSFMQSILTFQEWESLVWSHVAKTPLVEVIDRINDVDLRSRYEDSESPSSVASDIVDESSEEHFECDECDGDGEAECDCCGSEILCAACINGFGVELINYIAFKARCREEFGGNSSWDWHKFGRTDGKKIVLYRDFAIEQPQPLAKGE